MSHFWSSKYWIWIIYIYLFCNLIDSFRQLDISIHFLIPNVTQMSVFSGWNFFSFSTNSKLELIIQSPFKYGLSSISNHLHKAYSSVFIADRTSLRGQLVLWFLAKPYILPVRFLLVLIYNSLYHWPRLMYLYNSLYTFFSLSTMVLCCSCWSLDQSLFFWTYWSLWESRSFYQCNHLCPCLGTWFLFMFCISLCFCW